VLEMKKILAATSFVLLSLCASHSYAKSLWLKCGEEVINLDTDKQQYNIETRTKVVQGKASFFPNQINFVYQWLNDGHGGGLRSDYVIDRKTLEYTKTTMRKDTLLESVRPLYESVGIYKPNPYRDWAPFSSSPNPTTGVCKLIPDPTQENKI